VDLENLVRDPSYACRIEHANIKQTLNIMRAGPLRDGFQRGRHEDYEQLTVRLAELEDEGLKIWQRCAMVERRDEYVSPTGIMEPARDRHIGASGGSA
jgi:hypothetical protein